MVDEAEALIVWDVIIRKEVAMNAQAEAIARALGGRRCGAGWICRCPGPMHARGDRNPSLSLRDGDHALMVKCFAGCDASELLAIFRARGLLTGDAVKPEHAWQPRIYIPEHKPDPEAMSMLEAALALPGTLAETYLGIVRCIPPPYPAALRFLSQTSRGFPAMVAVVQAPDSSPIAVQVTYLDPSGRGKANNKPERMNVGELGWGAVRLSPAAAEMGIAEGAETALAAARLTGLAVWATLGSQRMHRVAIPARVRHLHIFGDNDEAGRVAADRTAYTHHAAGRQVTLRFPPNEVKDYADLLLERLTE
jgi:hypothetical protein